MMKRNKPLVLPAYFIYHIHTHINIVRDLYDVNCGIYIFCGIWSAKFKKKPKNKETLNKLILYQHYLYHKLSIVCFNIIQRP